MLFTLLLAPLSSIIIEADDLKEIAGHFQKLDQHSLLLWDVDSTLIIPSDQVLKPGNEDFLDELNAHYLSDKSEEELTALVSRIYHRMPFCLVDEQVVDLISNLQKRSIPMLGLTAMRTGSFGIIESMEIWRVNQLRSLRIDFSLVFPQHSGLHWQETTPYNGLPAFKEGIICCDHLPKGIVLTTFLQKINWRPNDVLFIDDNLDFLQSVEGAMEALNIPFTGVHYRAVEKMISPAVDKEMGHRQFQALVNRKIWLSDAEAKEISD